MKRKICLYQGNTNIDQFFEDYTLLSIHPREYEHIIYS
jgi:hypothetical protein